MMHSPSGLSPPRDGPWQESRGPEGTVRGPPQEAGRRRRNPNSTCRRPYRCSRPAQTPTPYMQPAQKTHRKSSSDSSLPKPSALTQTFRTRPATFDNNPPLTIIRGHPPKGNHETHDSNAFFVGSCRPSAHLVRRFRVPSDRSHASGSIGPITMRYLAFVLF